MKTTITDRLKTHVPSLLPREEWRMSKGPFHVQKLPQGFCNLWARYGTDEQYTLAQMISEADANLFAACNSAPPLVEELWEDYLDFSKAIEALKQLPTDEDTSASDADLVEPAIKEYERRASAKLRRLDAMSVLRWTPKEGE